VSEILIPSRKFLRLVDYMERIGLDPVALMQPLELTLQQLKAMPQDQGLPGTYYSRMYKQAVSQMQTLQRPIPWAAGIGSEAFEMMCYSIITCKNLGDALARAQRFDALIYPLIAYKVEHERIAPWAHLRYHVRTEKGGGIFVPEDWDRSEHYESVAKSSGLLIWYAFSGWLIGRSIELEQVQISGPYVSDEYRDGLQRVFQCPLHFGAQENQLIFSQEYLDQRLVHSPESLQYFLDNSIYQLIALSSKPASTSAAIRSLIKLDFSEGMPSFEQMAANLHMSESSLRRRLRKEDASYQQIKDKVRCEVAVEHLRSDNTKISDLAEILGFTEPSSFVRSFRSWTGLTPKVYRDNMKALATS
jgi:AraC-like DNA-binding protein